MIRVTLLIMTICVLSCKEKNGIVSKADNDGDPVVSLTSEDKEMNNAILKAKRSYDDFLATLKNPDSLMDDFSVKMRFDNGNENAEHMWLADLYFRNEKLFGVLNSDPVEINSVKAGDTLEVIRDRISDWMYLKQNKLVGGYTILAIYNKMSKEEQEQFKNQLGFELE